MRRSTYSKYNQSRKKSRPSSSIKGEKMVKKNRKIPKTKSNNEKYIINAGERTENKRKAEIENNTNGQNVDIYNQKDKYFNLDTLSYNFSLFLCYKDLKTFIQKKITSKFFKRWQHQFTSSVLRQIKSQKKVILLHEQNNNLNENQNNSYSPNLLQVQTTNQFFIDNDTNYLFNEQYTSNNFHHNHSHNHDYNSTKSTYLDSSPDPLFKGTSNPNEIAYSVISPNSPILIASTSPRDMNDDDNEQFLSVDEALDFSKYEKQNQNLASPDKKDAVDTFLQTITEFVSSDEFNSDSLGQLSTQLNPKPKENSPQSPSPPSNRIKPKPYHHDNNHDDPLGSTLPTDLFTSSEYSQNDEVIPKSFLKDEFSQSPKQKKEHQSPIKMDEELLIKAVLVDEFEHDKRKSKNKQNDNEVKQQNSPANRKKRKIIIVREYSDNDEDYALDKKTNNLNFNLPYDYINDNEDVIYQDIKRHDSFPVKKKVTRNQESPQKKFTFSDESFSEGETQEVPYNNNYQIEKSDTNSHVPNYNENANSHQDKTINYNDASTGNENTKNLGLNDKNEEDGSLQLSSTIEIPKVELKDIGKSSQNDSMKDDDSMSSEKNVSVMTMTDDRKNKNSDSEPFYGFGRKNNKTPVGDSSDEIEFLIKDDKENYVPIKVPSNTTNNSNKRQDDYNSNYYSYNDMSYDEDDF